MAAACAAFLLIACGGDDDGGDGDDGAVGPCEGDDAPPECGAACDESTPCADGFFCGEDGTCTAECTSAAEECAEGEECNADGQCVPGGSDDGADDGANDDGGDGGDDEDCPAVEVNLTPIVPDVELLIDQSGSMTESFPGSADRWTAINTALIGPNDDGIIFQLQGSLTMGASLYTANADPDDVIDGTCPVLRSRPQAVNNATEIKQLLNNNAPDDETPTGPSIDAVVAAFPASDNPRVIVLATDGLPDTCQDPNPGNDLPNPASDIEQSEANTVAETAVQNAFAAGILTVPLSVGPDVAQSHLQRVANAGQGLALDTLPPAAAPVYVANNPQDLIDAFEEIVGGIRSCEVEVEEAVDLDRADEGTVILNGDTLEYGTDWEMVDENTLTLLGGACDTFLSAPKVALSAEFPCGVIVDVD